MTNETCPVCGEGKLFDHTDTLTTTPHFYDFEVTIKTDYSVCNVCMSEIANAEQINRNAARMKAAIKEALDGKL